MINANRLAQPEVREKVTSSILHFLANLPESHKKIFIWKHYHGWAETQIASRLGLSSSEVESTLDEIRRTLFQRTEAILLSEPSNLEEADHSEESYATCCV
jgi:DNA-directed RNA polymerase specialized sigma24 family protein